MPTPQDNKARYAPLIQYVESQYGLPENLLLQLVQQESAFSEDVISGARVSRAGARGIAQFMPATATATAKALGIPDDQKWNPEQQIKMAGYLLSQSIKDYKSNSNPNISRNATLFAFAEYNAGRRNIQRAISLAAKGENFISALPLETRDYVQSVKNWSGQTVDNKPSHKGGNSDIFNRPDDSATHRFFNEFGQLTTTIDGFKKLPKDKINFMAKFLIGVGQGKIIKL